MMQSWHIVCPSCKKQFDMDKVPREFGSCCSEHCHLVELGLAQKAEGEALEAARELPMVTLDRHMESDDVVTDFPDKKRRRPVSTNFMANQLTDESLEKFPSMFRRAKHHAGQVAGREHQKSDRHERVGHFVTTLRRLIDQDLQNELPSKRKIVIDTLCDKAKWYDAGEIATTVDFTCALFGTNQVKQWLLRGSLVLSAGEAALDEADILLEELKEDIAALRPVLELNNAAIERGEKAADELAKLALSTAGK